MKRRAWLLFWVPVGLYLGWLAYLGWMVQGRPIQAPGYALVLSRPQILASPLDVIAELPGKDGKAKVVEVLYPAEGAAVKPGDEIDVLSIDECRPVSFGRGTPPPDDWAGPGRYLVPLRPAAGMKGKYEVSPIPPSPGFGVRVFGQPVRIYRDSAEVRAQYGRIAKPE
ncbi:MAG: hypothetical protein ACRC33_26640 [Gemmataceae bacterium]